MLKPQNLVQAAEADMKRALRNAEHAFNAKEFSGIGYEEHAFHRDHVRRADTASELLLLALMNPTVKTAKPNTRLIYGNAQLLIEAIRAADHNTVTRE